MRAIPKDRYTWLERIVSQTKTGLSALALKRQLGVS